MKKKKIPLPLFVSIVKKVKSMSRNALSLRVAKRRGNPEPRGTKSVPLAMTVKNF